MATESQPWKRFVTAAEADAKLWAFVLLLLAGFRLVLILCFHAHLAATTSWWNLAWGCGRGARFDMQLATFVALPGLLASLAHAWWDRPRLQRRIRLGVGAVFIVLAVPLMGIDLGFVGEYEDQFNQFLFGVVFDDLGAILRTVWSTYHVVPALLGMAALAAGLVWALRWWLELPLGRWAEAPARWPRWAHLAAGLALAVLLVCAARGSLHRRPIQQKDAAITADPFLNKLVPTAFHALEWAIDDYRERQEATGLETFVPDGDLVRAAAAAFPDLGPRPTVDDYLLRHAAGSAHPPRHLFVLIMESYDTWPMLEPYRALGLTTAVEELGKQGILIPHFLPIGVGTMSSLAGILTGLPDVGVFTAYRPSARRPFPSSPAAIFKRLDYRTRLFYSGYLSWQRIGDFCSDQGFDEVYGGGAIDAGASGNEWGADDEHLFAFVERNCPDDIPSFNVVLTTSNHPPFNVDVYGQGFPLRAIPAGLDADDNGSCPLLVLGHLWYSDRCVGRFIHAITAKLPRALVALTGDHWSRRCLNVRQSLFDKSAVPLLLYGPAVLDGVTAPARPFGGQLDIATTLIELSAPAGFAYHALGESVLTPERHVALGPTRVIGSDFLAVFSSPPVVVPLPGLPPPTTPPDLEALKRRYDALCGLAWWRIMRGNDLPPPR